MVVNLKSFQMTMTIVFGSLCGTFASLAWNQDVMTLLCTGRVEVADCTCAVNAALTKALILKSKGPPE